MRGWFGTVSETKQSGPIVGSTPDLIGAFPNLPSPPPGAFGAPPTSGAPRPKPPKPPKAKRVTHTRLQSEVRDYLSRRLDEARDGRNALDPQVAPLYRALAADRRVDIHADAEADKQRRLDAGLPTNIDAQKPLDLSKLPPDEIKAMRATLLKLESENT